MKRSAARPPSERQGALVRALAGFRAGLRAAGAGGASGAAARDDRRALLRAVRVELRREPGDADRAALRGACAALRGAYRVGRSAPPRGAAAEVVVDVDDVDEGLDEVLGVLKEAERFMEMRCEPQVPAGHSQGRGGIDPSASASDAPAYSEARTGDRSKRKAQPHSPSPSTFSDQPRLKAFHLNRTKGSPQAFSYTIRDVVVTHPRPTLCVIMNFLMDISFLAKHAPALFSADRILLVHGMQEGQLEREHLRAVFDSETCRRITLVRPETPRYGTVHSKAVLTFCGEVGCRVLVHSANDIEEDWLCRAQGAWWRDFERKKPGDCTSNFEQSLVDYFQAASKGPNRAAHQLEALVVPVLQKYNFASAGCQLVTSVPGHHGRDTQQDRNKYGHARLQALLSRESFGGGGLPGAAEKNVSVVMQFSSLGSITPKWMDEELHPALFSSANRIGGRDRERGDKLELVLPTLLQVAYSNESFAAGSSLPVRGANVHRSHIVDRLHGWCADISGRDRAMPHIKTIVRYDRTDPSIIDYVYIGSANLSGAAWGWTRKKGKRDEHLHILSYEMGILLTPQTYCPPSFSLGSAALPGVVPSGTLLPTEKYIFRHVADAKGWETETRGPASAATLSKACGDVSVPLPYRLPPIPYEAGDIPWHVDCGESSGCTPQCRALAAVLAGA